MRTFPLFTVVGVRILNLNVFRRKAPTSNAPSHDPRHTGIGGLNEPPDATRVIADLLSRPTQEGILEGALAHAVTLIGGNMQGYAVVRRGQDRVAAVFGYPKTLIGAGLSGPWATMRSRVLTDGSRELYELNGSETHELLDSCGMRGVQLSLIVPISDRGRNLGALVLDRSTNEGLTPSAQEAVTRWATAIAPLLGILDNREEWKLAARQITGALVEAVESREFDALGHAQAVASTSLQIGRGIGLAERELDELWYAAILHDIGKIHGETGHAQVGANFLHGVPHLAEAQRAIRHHHERWDGQGEPDKLSAEDIPLYGRILAVANAFVRLGDVEKLKAQAGKGLDARLIGVLEKQTL